MKIGDHSTLEGRVRYRVNHPQVINETIDDEAIMINLVSGNYYSLDSVGGEVWDLVEQSRSVDEIVTELGNRYEADEELIRRSVSDLFEEMSREQLVVPDEGAPAVAPVPSAPPVNDRLPFQAPKLQKFTDMQDLILLDPVHEVDSRGWPYAAEGRVAN
jgi:Coenzyme PQQ synthesis protein D (PqqD)